MLRRLTIQNVALIDCAELVFSEGLNVLTGETGSGKSVILDCIDFVLGAKADKGMVRTGAKECCVCAEFYTEDPSVGDVLRELDIEPEDTLVITRKLTADGRGSLRLNGCSVTAAMLRRVTSLLVDIHGQSEHFFLLKESNQLRLLDSLSGEPVSRAKERVGELLAARKAILADLGLLGGDEGERSRRMDILRYQIDEIGRAKLREGEAEELDRLRARYRSAEKILDGLGAARNDLLGEAGGADAVRDAHRALAPLLRFDDRYAELCNRLEASVAELEDIAQTVEGYAEELDVDEREAERIEARYDEIRTITKKYGGSVKDTLRFLEDAEREYALLSESGERFEKLTGELAELDKSLYEACRVLTQARKAAAADLTGRVVKELATLNIPSAQFEVQFDEYTSQDVPKATKEGLGGVRFLFSANKGEPMKELGKIISGGEMSRFMLAVKAQLSAAGGIGTYIFDEIDAGVGGKTARVVAEKFARIAKDVQLIAVTHLAQIAAFADRALVIEKREEGENTFTRVRTVEGEAQKRELARLIGGDSAHVLAHAEDLLAQAQAYKNSL